MEQIAIYLNVAFYLRMGVLALVRPAALTGYCSSASPPADVRNETRAVYGGFGLAAAGLLVAAPQAETLRPGILLAVSVLMLGMGCCRLLSVGLERPEGIWPVVFLGVEFVLGGLFLYAWFVENAA
ncbi:DUF4345 domain-containing protein [Rubrivirga sp. IMCC43871]|uniref:DUF4345 domain-containing protein n=1 Tax=Rubrivirga sp. IMCC43871 TaxID=3391575 RepID=UPI00398FC94B